MFSIGARFAAGLRGIRGIRRTSRYEAPELHFPGCEQYRAATLAGPDEPLCICEEIADRQLHAGQLDDAQDWYSTYPAHRLYDFDYAAAAYHSDTGWTCPGGQR